MHSEQGIKIDVTSRTAKSRRRKGETRVVLDIKATNVDGDSAVLTVDQENFLNSIARATGSTLTRSKAPAVYDGKNH